MRGGEQLEIGAVVTARAGIVGIPANVGAGRCFGRVVGQTVTQCGDRSGLVVIATLAITALSAGSGASRLGGHCPSTKTVTLGGDHILRYQHYATYRAMLALSETGSRASRGYSLIDDSAVSGGRNHTIHVTVPTNGAGMGCITLTGARGIDNYRFVAVSLSRDGYIGCVVTTRARLIRIPADLGAGGRLGRVVG